jgi:hypothetical protein
MVTTATAVTSTFKLWSIMSSTMLPLIITHLKQTTTTSNISVGPVRLRF